MVPTQSYTTPRTERFSEGNTFHLLLTQLRGGVLIEENGNCGLVDSHLPSCGCWLLCFPAAK